MEAAVLSRTQLDLRFPPCLLSSLLTSQETRTRHVLLERPRLPDGAARPQGHDGPYHWRKRRHRLCNRQDVPPVGRQRHPPRLQGGQAQEGCRRPSRRRRQGLLIRLRPAQPRRNGEDGCEDGRGVPTDRHPHQQCWLCTRRRCAFLGAGPRQRFDGARPERRGPDERNPRCAEAPHDEAHSAPDGHDPQHFQHHWPPSTAEGVLRDVVPHLEGRRRGLLERPPPRNDRDKHPRPRPPPRLCGDRVPPAAEQLRRGQDRRALRRGRPARCGRYCARRAVAVCSARTRVGRAHGDAADQPEELVRC